MGVGVRVTLKNCMRPFQCESCQFHKQLYTLELSAVYKPDGTATTFSPNDVVSMFSK